MKRIKFFASILLMLCLSVVCCAQTKIDWKQIKNIPDTLEFKNVLLEHLLFKSAYQPVMESIHQGAIYYDNMTERMRVYEHGQWRDLSVTIASDSIGAPLTILGYLQASDIYASQSAYIGKDVNVKGNVNASGTSTFNYLKVNNALEVPTVACAALGVGSVYYDTSANKLKVLNSSNQWKVVSVDVDSALSTTSTNPVENKAITAKINQTDADLINGMATTLQASYNYSNGIATQAYNYANSVASDAESASKNYADTQLGIMRDYVSQQLGSGTSDLYVKSIRTTNASVTNKLSVKYATFERGIAIPIDYSSQYITVAGDPNLVGLHYNSANDTISFSKNLNGGYQAYNLARADNTVSDVATGTNNTIAVTKNGVTTNIAVGGSTPSSSTPPSNPSVGQSYFDTDEGVIKYWNGDEWVEIGGDIASETTSFVNVFNMYKYSNLHENSSYVPIWDMTPTPASANISMYFWKISENHKIITFRVEYPDPPNNNPLAVGTYGFEIPSSVFDSNIKPFVSGLTLDTINLRVGYGAIDIVNPRIFTEGLATYFYISSILWDQKTTQIGNYMFIIHLHFRKYKSF